MVISETSSSTPVLMRGRGLLPPSSVLPISMSGRGRLPPSSVQPILMRGRGRLPPSPFPPIVRPGRGVFVQTANVQDKPVQISKLQGPGRVDTVEASEVIDYPAPVSGQDFILHIEVDNATVPPSKVIDAMKEAELISGTISETKLSSNTYLVSSGVLGSHELLFGAVRCVAHLLAYEPQHSGHRGRFAPGYSGFLCGMSRPTVARVLLRAEIHELTIVVSRSYSDDCKNVATTLNRESSKTSHQFHVKESCKCKELPQPYPKTDTRNQDWSHFLQSMGVLFKNVKTEEDFELNETPRECCLPSLHKEVKSLVQSVNTSSVRRYQHPSRHPSQDSSRPISLEP